MAEPEPNARVAWLEGLMGEHWGVRQLERAIKESNGGEGPSRQTLSNLLDPNRPSKVEEYTITQIASFFQQDPADVERQLNITLSPSARLMLLAFKTEGLREAAVQLAALPEAQREAFQEMIRQAAANSPAAPVSLTQPETSKSS
ncbi:MULTISPECIES: hypothetical protein [unclassified Nonomuraea]|uniref:hypothetical protein n=1 Tax=unclassified Nonomuraea TaxID=2593643 RepID=UPI0033F8E0E9